MSCSLIAVVVGTMCPAHVPWKVLGIPGSAEAAGLGGGGLRDRGRGLLAGRLLGGALRA